MEVSCEGETKDGGPSNRGPHAQDINTPRRPSWISSSSSSTAAVAAAAAAAAAGSPQRLQSSHTIEEIRARLRPRIQSGGAGASTACVSVSSLESLPLSPLPLRLRLQSDAAAAPAAAAAAAATAAAAAGGGSPHSSSGKSVATATAAAAAAERPVYVHREGESPPFRRSGTDGLDGVLRRRQAAAEAAAEAAAQAAAEAAAAAAEGKLAAASLSPADQANCLLMLHELLAFVDALESHRQQAVFEASRLRCYNAEMALMLQQANAREQQLFRELQGHRSLLVETHNNLQLLQRSAEETAGSLKTQRDSLMERLQAVEAELERCHQENEQLLRQHALDEASLRELAAIRQSHGIIEREKKQLQSELEAQSVASSRLLNERIELQGQLHRLQIKLQDVESTDPARLHSSGGFKEKAPVLQVFGDGGLRCTETDEEGSADMLLLLQQLVSEVSPHLSETRRQELLQQGPARKLLDAFLQIRAEKNEFHGYALELLNRLDALGGHSPSIANSQLATVETCATAASLVVEDAAAAAAAPAAAAPDAFAAAGPTGPKGDSSRSSSSSSSMTAAPEPGEEQQ
ncbi:hypothetical protein Efla_004825 [Eimeria flavescens]